MELRVSLTPKKRMISFSAVTLTLLFLTSPMLAIAPSAAYGFQNAGQFASIVIGQPNFVSSTQAATPNHLFRPYRVAFDHSGDLWVADENNNRILEFKSPLTDGESASLELGQPSFTSSIAATTQSRFFAPTGLTFDSSGNLWVADVNNNRILEFKAPFENGMNASLELGQPSGSHEFTSNSPSAGPNRFHSPLDVKLDSSGNLWLSDAGNDRVLEFKPPFSNGMNASTVIGQVNLTTGPSTLVSPSTDSLFGPNGITFDSMGNLWVADQLFNRVLEFAAVSLGSNDPSAILEIGQHAGVGEFTSAVAAGNRSGFVAPFSLAFDPSGNLWVSDRADNRVLEFMTPFTNGMNASTVIGHPAGQNEFTDNSTGLAQAHFSNPLGIAFDMWGDLWVADQLNNRVLGFSGAAVATIGVNVDVPTTTDETGTNVSASNGNACYRIAFQAVCHLIANQASATGIETDMIGVASASTVNVYSSYFGSQGPAYFATTRQGAIAASSPVTFYGLAISGIGNGTATVCIDQKQQTQAGRATGATGMMYYSNGIWASPTSVSSGASITCGTIPLSALSSRSDIPVIAIGGSGGSDSSNLGLNTLLYVSIPIIVILISAFLVVRRKAKNRDKQEEEADDLEEAELWW
ncbi:MAG: NHL repeat-containing protein [Thaumarchaeota archaeon]|nr:NHL repeat-containing protein [Nitrososphaerota archaeon]